MQRRLIVFVFESVFAAPLCILHSIDVYFFVACFIGYCTSIRRPLYILPHTCRGYPSYKTIHLVLRAYSSSFFSFSRASTSTVDSHNLLVRSQSIESITRSSTNAEAPPPPLQIPAHPSVPPSFFSVLSRVQRIRAPEQPSGCPRLTAPP